MTSQSRILFYYFSVVDIEIVARWLEFVAEVDSQLKA